MESLFIVNPRGKKRRKGKMPAGLRRYWASRRRGKNPKRRRARNPIRHYKRRRARNPKQSRVTYRRKARARYHAAHPGAKRRRRARNPIRYSRRRHRAHNPFSTRGLKGVLVPAAYGAGGAIATAIAYGYLAPKLPTALTTGYMPVLVKAAAAIGLGMLIGKFMSRQDGQYATVGGLTVVLVGAVTPLITQNAPTIPGLSGLAGYGDYIPHRPIGAGIGAYSPSLTRSKTNRFGRLGFISPAARLGAYSPTLSRNASPSDLSGSGFNGLNDGM